MVKIVPKTLSARAGVLLICIAMAACSLATKRAGATSGHDGSSTPTHVTHASSTFAQVTPSPAAPGSLPRPDGVPLRTPARVASGRVTESRGTWNRAVQRITYLSSADNTRQPMMFYTPPADEPRPLLVGLHSWSAGYRQDESVIYAEWCIANDWGFIHPHFRGANVSPQATGSELVIGDVLSAIVRERAWPCG